MNKFAFFGGGKRVTMQLTGRDVFKTKHNAYENIETLILAIPSADTWTLLSKRCAACVPPTRVEINKVGL